MSEKVWESLAEIRVIDSSYNHVAWYNDFQALTIEQQWGGGGIAVVTVPEGHDLLNYAVLDQLVFIILSHPNTEEEPFAGIGIDINIEFRGHVRDSQISTDDLGNVVYLIYIDHLTSVLDRYVTGYPTGLNNRSEWVGQELAVIANDLVTYNATAAGTVVDGRIRDVTVIGGMQGAGALGGTAVVNYAIDPGRNLLGVLTELGEVLNFANVVGTEWDFVGDYSLIGDLRARQVQSVDRSDTVYFALELDNMANVSLVSDSSRERTVAIVGGMGEGVTRPFSVRLGANYALDNDKEIFIGASTRDTSELDDIGDIALGEHKARVILDAEIFSSRGWVYNREYFLGDFVAVYFGNIVAVKVVESVRWAFDQGIPPQQLITLVDVS